MQWCLKIQLVGQKEQVGISTIEAAEEHHGESALNVGYIVPTVHFVETATSILRELPWITLKEYEEDGPQLTFEKAQNKCKGVIKNFAQIQLVYGEAGDGKTHHIKEQLCSSSNSVTIAVNEAFTSLRAIQKLRTLPLTQKGCNVFLNFTMLPPGASVDESENKNYKELMKLISWFFFDLFLLAYVEDPITGLSVSIPGGMDWKIYVEVPSQIGAESPQMSLHQFIEDFPALGMLGDPYLIQHNTPYTVDDDVQLVCKYLNAYWLFAEKKGTGINRLHREGKNPVKFSADPSLSHKECHKLLEKSWTDFVEVPKVMQKLFIKYMKRRCDFLDKTPAFNYNPGSGEYYGDQWKGKRKVSDTRELGSTLMSTMLQEVKDFCNFHLKQNWLQKAHQQLIYDFKDGGGSFGLLSLNPEKLPKEDRLKFEKIRVHMPSMMELHERKTLDEFLSRALSVELKDGYLTLITKSNYVLTLDYATKMLNIHERRECGVPVIIEGETGVGKTALLEMLSKLWNQSLLNELRRRKRHIIDIIQRRLGELCKNEQPTKEYNKAVKCVEADNPVEESDVVDLCLLQDTLSATGYIYTTLRSELLKMKGSYALPLLTVKGSDKSLDEVFSVYSALDNKEATGTLLHAVMMSEVKSTFHKINVHSALTPDQIWTLLQPAITQANSLIVAYENSLDKGSSLHPPLITVFLDEVNTSSCLGLFKEIIIDHTFDGEPIPENIFIVAACNPHRGNSLAVHENWTRSTYYVRQLHPTLDFLKWDYGALEEQQEGDYINVKLKMLNKEVADIELEYLTDIIAESQEQMRRYACKQLSLTVGTEDSIKAAQSCVSQRDIQRVFTFFKWFKNLYKVFKQHGHKLDYPRRALMVSLGIVYYMRLNTKYREEFKDWIDRKYRSLSDVNFSDAFQQEIEWFIRKMELPTGIAKTQALMENLFATVVCTCTHTPLIIVGAPGSSKTLSFNLAIANLKGQESKMEIFRMPDVFPSLDPHFYQCSRRTTSNEIETVFSRAINRQKSHSHFKLPIYCVVFMDEAGLPEESHESLKVLHYHLDRQQVSFVAITNNMLDAAKSNRAVCLFRPEAMNDLSTLAKGCLISQPDSHSRKLQKCLDLAVESCKAFSKLMKDETFSHFFGLRDFIHFINYLRRRRHQMLQPHVVMEAIERNFNGSENFENIANEFLTAMNFDYNSVQKRNILDVLNDSLHDHPQSGKYMSDNEVRYKLIIDPSEDGSLMHLLFSLGVLDRQLTRIYVCSDFPGDSQTQKIDTIAAIRHSAVEGHTVVMSQTDSVHESFYDLFNQRFRCIDDPVKGPRYYTNIAIGAHSRPCRIHPNFQCVVVLKKTEVRQTPAPFLNRFEKYCINHSMLLETALAPLPPLLKRVVISAKEKVENFVNHVGCSGFYGLHKDTVDSLILSILPPLKFNFQQRKEEVSADSTMTVEFYMLKLLLMCLRKLSGFHISQVLDEELSSDAEDIFAFVMCDAEFQGIMERMKQEWDVAANTNGSEEEETRIASNSIDVEANGVEEYTDEIDTIAEADNAVNAGEEMGTEERNSAERQDKEIAKEVVDGHVQEDISPMHVDKTASGTVETTQVDAAVHRAINALHSKKEKQRISPQGCLVVQVLLQWLVRYLIKRMMQLMTVEGFVEHSHGIPLSYLKIYLAHQAHFSLKNLIQKYIKCQIHPWNSTSKVLCFTRSSSLIHQIPAMYPKSSIQQPMGDDVKQTLQSLVHEDVEKLMVFKLSSVSSQRHVLELLHTFTRSDQVKILLVVVNMQELRQKEVVNHLRIMIEQEEAVTLREDNKEKLFVLLLHFPPSKFRNGCYPSLFLQGWDHYYLDTIAHSVVTGFDIEKWLWEYCFPQDTLPSPNEDPLIATLKEILHEAIPILASRVYFGFVKDGPFNTKMSASNRSVTLKELFFEKGLGDVLCERFRSYWKPKVMSKYLEKAVVFTRAQDSTLNITDSMHSTFKNLFFDFLVYMITKINEDCNIDVLFLPNSSPAILNLFISIVKQISIPELSELKIRSVHCQHENRATTLPQFPFFKMVSGEVERITEESREGVNTKMITLEDLENDEIQATSSYKVQQSYFHQLVNNVVEKLGEALSMDQKSGFFASSLKALKDSPELWDCYFNHFIVHTLHLEGTQGISQKILQTIFAQLCKEDIILKRIVKLHVHMNVSHLQFARMATIFRSLDQIHEVSQLAPSNLYHLVTSSTDRLVEIIQRTKHPLGTHEHLCSFVVDHLFSALVGAVITPDSEGVVNQFGNLLTWYQLYRDVMSLPFFKEQVYSSFTRPDMDVEARLNVTQCVFIVMQSYTAPSQSEPSQAVLAYSQRIFHNLLNQFFNANMETMASFPTLEGVSKVVLMNFPHPEEEIESNQVCIYFVQNLIDLNADKPLLVGVLHKLCMNTEVKS
jgi:hypothetical protein